jgi:hypothetical protein
MKPTFTAILVAVALSLAAAGAQGAGSTTGGSGASSVADMLQRKQESELRVQLVREGRSEEVRTLDEAKAQQLQTRREQVYLHVNAQLARGTSAEKWPLTDARALECEPDGRTVK